jgi:prepilin-type N-terminal cleavage/methylation domain-containing protein
MLLIKPARSSSWRPQKESAVSNRLLKKSRSQAGFTLIEMLIVVAIIGILAAIGIPTYLDHRDRAYNAAAQADLKNFRAGMEAYFADHQRYPVL